MDAGQLASISNADLVAVVAGELEPEQRAELARSLLAMDGAASAGN